MACELLPYFENKANQDLDDITPLCLKKQKKKYPQIIQYNIKVNGVWRVTQYKQERRASLATSIFKYNYGEKQNYCRLARTNSYKT